MEDGEHCFAIRGRLCAEKETNESPQALGYYPSHTGWAGRGTVLSNGIVRTGLIEARGDTSGPC